MNGTMATVVIVRPWYRPHIITPPIGLGYLSSSLQQKGHQVTIVDGLKERLDLDKLEKRVLSLHPDVVCISAMSAYYPAASALSCRLVQRGVRVIIGGAHATALPQQTLSETKADAVIVGYAELALCKLLNDWDNRREIPGVYRREGAASLNSVITTAELPQNLDQLPFPDWQQMTPSSYPKAPHGAFARHFPIGVIVSSRGCAYRCSFCASPALCGGKVKFRSPENIVEEIKLLVEHFGVREIHFDDDNLTLKHSHVA